MDKGRSPARSSPAAERQRAQHVRHHGVISGVDLPATVEGNPSSHQHQEHRLADDFDHDREKPSLLRRGNLVGSVCRDPSAGIILAEARKPG